MAHSLDSKSKSAARGYAAASEKAPLAPYSFERRAPGPNDVEIGIAYCGICHTDIHIARNEWGRTIYPVVPGHEIVGRVKSVGTAVTKFKPGDWAGVGCMVNSCRTCSRCQRGQENYCERGSTLTYNSMDADGSVTYGGYSDHVVVNQDFVLRLSHSASQMAAVAPLLCAGITTYSPLRHWGAGPGKKVGVIGLGGLGHMAVKLAHAMGAEVTLFTRSKGKVQDAQRLGADATVITNEAGAMEGQKGFDLIINTVAAAVDVNPYLEMLRSDGTLVLVGVPDRPLAVAGFPLIMGRRALAGSLIGGIAETQEMLDFCAKRGIVSDIEMIAVEQVNEAFDRVVKSDVRYRFVMDMSSLGNPAARA
ncbi:MAG TPA: NAD(P)-dependent alcohol dehydrogenase [Terriglobales bacterium]|nr:NAD(P)-dependent alcohol dehydrogenase [Terriglobales bacterium]